MCTRLLLLIVTCLGLFSSSKADDGIKARKARYPTKQASPIKPANAAVSLPSTRQGNALSGILLAINEKNDNGSKLNPRAISFVQDYIAKNGDDLQEIKSWCKPYFNLMDGILAQYGLPVELKYLAVIESELKASCVSGVGAAGPWQLMPETAKILGL